MKKIATLVIMGTLTGAANAAVITIDNLDVRSGGIYGHNDHVGVPPTNQPSVTINGEAPTGISVFSNPINVQMTYSNLDLDGDSSANDAVTFTLSAVHTAAGAENISLNNQGFNSGANTLSNLMFSVTDVSGTTTDSGKTIVFDGFTGAAIGSGAPANTDLNQSAEINGILASIVFDAVTDGYQFKTAEVNFALADTVTFDNSAGTSGTLVARTYDLQFSTVPEPATVSMLGLGALSLFVLRRRIK